MTVTSRRKGEVPYRFEGLGEPTAQRKIISLHCTKTCAIICDVADTLTPDTEYCRDHLRYPQPLASHKRILNVTRGVYLKINAAQRAIEECSAVWIEPGVSIRLLTLDEGRKARIEQAANREPLPYAELPGIKFVPSASGQAATRNEGRLTMDAHLFIVSPQNASA